MSYKKELIVNPELIRKRINEHYEMLESISVLTDLIHQAGRSLLNCINTGGRVYVCGNGGSASDAQHFSAELTGRFVVERRGYPVVALTTDTSALTAIGNDYGFNYVFSRQLEAQAKTGDMLVAISTSGNSTNVIAAVELAKRIRVGTIGILGRKGGELANLVDIPLIVAADSTARIQEGHILILHLLCEAFEPK